MPSLRLTRSAFALGLVALAGCGPMKIIELIDKLDDDDPAPPAPSASAAPIATTPPAPMPDAAVDGCAAAAAACTAASGCCEGSCSEDRRCEACKDAGAVCNYFQGGGCCLGAACEPQGSNGNGTCLSCRRSGDPIPSLDGKPLVRTCCSKAADTTGARCL